MKKLLILLIVGITFLGQSCTENTRAKAFGGKISVSLPKGTKLVTATWKESNLWYLYEPAESGYVPKKVIFQEESNFGIANGTVEFIEQ